MFRADGYSELFHGFQLALEVSGLRPSTIKHYTIDALGLGFVAGVCYEWYLAFQHFPPSSAYGTVFFTITGIHAFHVITGIILLAVVAYLARKPERFGQSHSWGVEGGVKYWHFVDVAWVFIYPTLYLVG